MIAAIYAWQLGPVGGGVSMLSVVTRLAVLGFTLAALAVPSDAADAGHSTMATWFTMSPVSRITFVVGSIDMLAALGLTCPGNVTGQDVNDSLRTRLSLGELKADANLAGAILGTLLGKGCKFSQGGTILRALADRASVAD